MELFSAFLSTLRQLISDERELCGYAGQDPAVDMWIRAAETSLDASKAACTAVIEAAAPGVVDRAFCRVARLFLQVINSDDPGEVASLRDNARLRRWAYLVPAGGADASAANLKMEIALDALEVWLALEDSFEARMDDEWADLDNSWPLGPYA